MRDWNVLVRKRFNGRGLTELQQTEVVSELAAHLEDLYEHERSSGITEAVAVSRALNEVDNWRQLSRNINRTRKTEGQMNSRTKSLWLPGLTTLTVAMGALAIIMGHDVHRFYFEPRIYWYGSMAVMEIYLPWLAILPIIGGIGAYLSRLANGNLKTRLAAALFPALVVFALFCPGVVVTAVFEHHLNWHVLPVAFAGMVFSWVLLPGSVLALGALPFLGLSRVREAYRRDS